MSDKPAIPERCWAEARDIVFQKFSAIQLLNDYKLDRAFSWPPDDLVKETAMRLAAEAALSEATNQTGFLTGKVADKDDMIGKLSDLVDSLNKQLRTAKEDAAQYKCAHALMAKAVENRDETIVQLQVELNGANSEVLRLHNERDSAIANSKILQPGDLVISKQALLVHNETIISKAKAELQTTISQLRDG